MKNGTDRLAYGRTFVIGLGFFTTAVSWSLYNSYVPIFLQRHVSSAALIGFVMTLDNWSAIVIQPWIGALSDRTSTRMGRRMPYIAAGVPLGALLFSAIPVFAGMSTFLPVFLVIMGFNLAMALYRAPVVALMPDVTASAHRSKANGVINLMGGVGSILAFLGGSYLYELGNGVPFYAASAVMLIALVILLAAVRENRLRLGGTPASEAQRRPAIIRSIRDVIARREYSTIFILAAIFFWFFAYNGVETWFTTYGVKVLGIKENVAARMVSAVALSFVVFALPAGFVGTRLGRKRTILVGLGLFIVVLVLLIVLRTAIALWVLLALAGLAWALINVNSITIVWELAPGEHVGTYTGLYYFASAAAQIVSPPLLGLVFDNAGMSALFPAAAVLMAVAALMMLGVKSGEAVRVEKGEAQ